MTQQPSVAIIVVSQEQATLINESGALNENSWAFAYDGHIVMGDYDIVVVLDPPVTDKERDWITRVAAGSPIRYPST